MSFLKVLGAALAATVLVSAHAYALTITNRDTSSHTLMIQKGDNESEVSLPAGESIEEQCEEACVLRLAGAEGEQTAQDSDRFFIENGSLQREQE